MKFCFTIKYFMSLCHLPMKNSKPFWLKMKARWRRQSKTSPVEEHHQYCITDYPSIESWNWMQLTFMLKWFDLDGLSTWFKGQIGMGFFPKLTYWRKWIRKKKRLLSIEKEKRYREKNEDLLMKQKDREKKGDYRKMESIEIEILKAELESERAAKERERVSIWSSRVNLPLWKWKEKLLTSSSWSNLSLLLLHPQKIE